MQSLRLSDSVLESLLLERGLCPRDIAQTGPVWEIGIESEPDADDVLYVSRRPGQGWQVQTGQVEALGGRIPPAGIRTSWAGDIWWVDTGPDREDLGHGLECLAQALWLPYSSLL